MFYTHFSAPLSTTSHFFVEVDRVQLPYPEKYFNPPSRPQNSWSENMPKTNFTNEDKERFENFIGKAAFVDKSVNEKILTTGGNSNFGFHLNVPVNQI